jgi:hypothetical protein
MLFSAMPANSVQRNKCLLEPYYTGEFRVISRNVVLKNVLSIVCRLFRPMFGLALNSSGKAFLYYCGSSAVFHLDLFIPSDF